VNGAADEPLGAPAYIGLAFWEGVIEAVGDKILSRAKRRVLSVDDGQWKSGTGRTGFLD
jgi:hypothetical protein